MFCISFVTAVAAWCGTTRAEEIPRVAEAFTRFVAARVKTEASSKTVAVKGPLTLTIGSLEANLDRVYTYCAANASGCLTQIDTYIAAVLEMATAEPEKITREMVRWRQPLERFGSLP